LGFSFVHGKLVFNIAGSVDKESDIMRNYPKNPVVRGVLALATLSSIFGGIFALVLGFGALAELMFDPWCSVYNWYILAITLCSIGGFQCFASMTFTATNGTKGKGTAHINGDGTTAYGNSYRRNAHHAHTITPFMHHAVITFLAGLVTSLMLKGFLWYFSGTTPGNGTGFDVIYTYDFHFN